MPGQLIARDPASGLDSLPRDERRLIELLSVFSDTAPLSTIVRAFGKIGHRIEGRIPRNDDVVPLLRRLTERGMLLGETAFAVPAAVAHGALRSAAREGRLEILGRVVREVRPARKAPEQRLSTWALGLRELRIELHTGGWEAARLLLREMPRGAFYDVCQPFDRAWIEGFPADLRAAALAGIVHTATALLEPALEPLAMLEAEPALTDGEDLILVERLLLAGSLEEAARRLAARRSLESEVGRAFLSLVHGRTTEAIAAYEAALKAFLRVAGKRAAFFPDRLGLFFVVALLAEGSPSSLTRATELTDAALRTKSLALQAGFGILSDVASMLSLRTELEDLLYIRGTRGLASRDPIEILLQAAAHIWARTDVPREVRAELEKRRVLAEAAGLTWYSAQATFVLAGSAAKAAGAHADVKGLHLAELIAPRERWVETLEALLALASPVAPARPVATTATGEARQRLVWMVRFAAWGVGLEPREQSKSKGTWSKGRPVALKRLFEDAKGLTFLTTADRAVCAMIASETTYEYGRYARVSYSLDAARALHALAGSANVLVEGPGGSFEPCEIQKEAPRLEVATTGTRLGLRLEPRPRRDDEQFTAVARGPRSVAIVAFAPIHHAIARALGAKPLDLPVAAEPRLRAVLTALSSRVAVHADLPEAASDALAVRGDSRPLFLLRPLGEGLSVAARVRPLGHEGPSARPGHGGATLFARIAGRDARATRDLAAEALRLDRALAACPVLSDCRRAGADLVVPDRDRALEVLLELRALGQDVGIEWPDGEGLLVSDPVDLERLCVVISGAAGSFVARGSLAIPGGKNVELANVLDFLAASPGRFLRLAGDDRYVALTTDLRRRLDEIVSLSTRAGRGLRVPALVAPLVADLLGSCRLEADVAWQRQIERLTARGTEPAVPSTLKGELRPYQIDGFRWLVRLSSWGAGACLADEMGLGKTLQAIALFLHRAADGPGLVVAPTSVVANWVDEVQRFAPTLRVRTFAGPTRGRDLAGLGPFDLLVTSYGILQRDVDTLAMVPFATAVLDEAQVIKNAETKRAHAASRLQAEFRVATTGTPIENRLDDLHALFTFTNPGLLGSETSFQARFVGPIERDQDALAKDRLRRLAAPFILRRTKTQVLPELPPRTEVTLRVPLELEELALYEVIRKEALDGLASGAGPTRFAILAAIMRLRLAASNARLVLPDSSAPSAKLAALEDLLDDLLPNDHRLLVFSQFIGHLALVKELLDRRGVSYQYLDGSTPPAARKVAIDAFQEGRGSVFLISLKAGGFGLNLTAADYVVHMDPWWNPAVEDQASDRAHRIGQTRSVTVYRLVARDTIEDRILDLHHRKRELAAGILEGGDLAGRMSEEALLELVRGPR